MFWYTSSAVLSVDRVNRANKVVELTEFIIQSPLLVKSTTEGNTSPNQATFWLEKKQQLNNQDMKYFPLSAGAENASTNPVGL